jgi:hypothetical protein
VEYLPLQRSVKRSFWLEQRFQRCVEAASSEMALATEVPEFRNFFRL